ncbi:uncharacterized protein LOC130441634 [Diorhabda sublineata]|uniref:uncharacterized protein LOC130441634 n=1 Tax=Diorhabda sublineata TaxID=1163346 RepID=UPI0024E0DCFB|nr:uncharacterized protein LOC130441634 [Diorhabda sublineata]
MGSDVDTTIKSDTQEEDDVDCFFLQPSSSPYNIAEKVQQANIDLFSSSPCPSSGKLSKVKFKDDLYSFEPDLTDEDVNSIESDNIEDLEHDNQLICEYKTVNISDIEEVAEDVEDEEIIESINADCNEIVIDNIVKSYEYRTKVEKETFEELKTDNCNTSKHSSKRKNNGSKQIKHIQEVQCRNHCIDKLDFDLPMYIKKLEIHEKVANLPPLQLIQRKCCDELKQKNLPNYNGLRSEYGLSSRQLENRQKHKELLRLKEQTRQKILEEYTKRKMQQNEEVFCQWLKQIAKRRNETQKMDKNKVRHKNNLKRVKQLYSPSVISMPNKNTGRMKERPKTANEFVPKTQIKKPRRPYSTSSTCVYIEVPENILKKGINIGDLLVTNSKLLSKKLHILAVS